MRILLFLKAPRSGTVKTRIAKTLGQKKALEIYRKLVARQLSTLPESCELQLHFSPADAEVEMREWLGAFRTYIPQCEGDLGDRLSQAVKRAFDQHSTSVACIGADCPDLNNAHFEEAEKALHSGNDLVVGPTRDGGYYLIAMNNFHPELFLDIPWSSASTFAETIRKAVKNELKVHLLETLEDIDHEEDWRRAQTVHNFLR